MEHPVVLVIDDEPKIRDILRLYLQADGFSVIEQADGTGGLDAALTTCPNLVILDIMLPGFDGFEVLRRLRESSQVPVILLTSRDEEVDKLIGLEVGADDYVTKPFSGRELAGRVRAILRRIGAAPALPEGPVRRGALVIDPARREVAVNERPVTLSALDFDLLLALARHPGQVLSRGQLLRIVWGDDYFGDDRVVDVHIKTLRKALGDDAASPFFIATVRSVGYRLIVPRPA